MTATQNFKTTKKLRWPKDEDDLKNKDDPEIENTFKIKDGLKRRMIPKKEHNQWNGDNIKNEDDPKNENRPRIEDNSRLLLLLMKWLEK